MLPPCPQTLCACTPARNMKINGAWSAGLHLLRLRLLRLLLRIDFYADGERSKFEAF